MISFSTLTSKDAPSFDEPMEMLLACHGRVRDFCRQLDALSAHLARHGLDEAAGNSIAAIVRYFDVAGPAHHQDEEDELFPILRAKLPEAAANLDRLHNDHLTLQQTWQQIRGNLLALSTTQPILPPSPDIAAYTALYREHAELEESWLFPQAIALLDEEQLRTAGQRMARRRQAPTS